MSGVAFLVTAQVLQLRGLDNDLRDRRIYRGGISLHLVERHLGRCASGELLEESRNQR